MVLKRPKLGHFKRKLRSSPEMLTSYLFLFLLAEGFISSLPSSLWFLACITTASPLPFRFQYLRLHLSLFPFGFYQENVHNLPLFCCHQPAHLLQQTVFFLIVTSSPSSRCLSCRQFSVHCCLWSSSSSPLSLTATLRRRCSSVEGGDQLQPFHLSSSILHFTLVFGSDLQSHSSVSWELASHQEALLFQALQSLLLSWCDFPCAVSHVLCTGVFLVELRWLQALQLLHSPPVSFSVAVSSPHPSFRRLPDEHRWLPASNHHL